MFYRGLQVLLLVALTAPMVLSTPAAVVQVPITSPLQSPDIGLQMLHERLQNFIYPSNWYAYQLWDANYSTANEANELCLQKLAQLHGLFPTSATSDCTLESICTTDSSRFPSLLITGRCYGTSSAADYGDFGSQSTACGELGFDSCRPLEQTITILVKAEPEVNTTAEEWRLGLQNIVTGCQCV